MLNTLKKYFVGDSGKVLRGIGTVDLTSATQLKFRLVRGSLSNTIEVIPTVSDTTNLIYTTGDDFPVAGVYSLYAHANFGFGGMWTKIVEFNVYDVPAVSASL